VGDTDQAIKRLLQSHPQDFLRIALPDAQYLGTLPTDVATERQLILDTLFRVRIGNEWAAVNFEAQTQIADDMPRRCYEYAARVMSIHRLNTFSVVLWLKRGGKVPQPPYEIRVGPHLLGTWNFINVEIYNFQARDILRDGILGLIPLIPLMAGADRETDEEAMRFVGANTEGDQRKSIATLLAIFISRQYDKEIANAIVRSIFMSTELLDESPLYREWIERATAEGLAKGLAEGQAKGKAEGERAVIQRILESRFGTVDPQVAEMVNQADFALLDDLIPHIAIDTLEQIRQRLGLGEPKAENGAS